MMESVRDLQFLCYTKFNKDLDKNLQDAQLHGLEETLKTLPYRQLANLCELHDLPGTGRHQRVAKIKAEIQRRDYILKNLPIYVSVLALVVSIFAVLN